MKLSSWLVGIVILLMSCLPCADAAIGHSNANRAGLNNSYATESHRDQAIDACSPFCVCSCCHTPSVMKQVLLTTQLNSELNNQYADMQLRKLTSAPIAFWQPPKLG